MARKDRVPSPPRSPQGPKQRREASTPSDIKRMRLALGAFALTGVVGAVAVIGFLVLGGGGASGAVTAMKDAGCTLESFAAQARTHLTDENAKPKWNSFPPTSGPHYGRAAVWGAYDEPLNQLQVVHNLEHGGVAIQYGDKVPAETVAQLRSFYGESPNGLLFAPLPKLGRDIALTVWNAEPDTPGEQGKPGRGILAKCRIFDDKAFSEFLAAYQGKGPERIPLENLAPGT